MLLVSAFLWRKGSEFEKWGKSRNAKMGGKDDVAIWRRGGGGGGRSTDELHPEPSGHFKLILTCFGNLVAADGEDFIIPMYFNLLKYLVTSVGPL